MPGMDGFEVLGRLRKDPRYSRTPIVMLTSLGQEADVVRGFGLGADDYILKPFSPTELTARVRRLLARGRASSAV
jgi:DNA-binding response OmpR family regulator